MGVVISVRRKEWAGVDADKTGVSAGVGDKYFATDTKRWYTWNGASWVREYSFKERLTGAGDIDQITLTLDGTWKVNGLILSGIVPAGAIAVLLRLSVSDNLANQAFQIRRDAVNGFNSVRVTTQVANVAIGDNCVLSIDSDRLMDYNGVAGIASISITVMGWWI